MINKLFGDIEKISDAWLFLLMTALFCISSAVFLLVGVRFDMRPLTYFWQYIDVVLLRERLIESVFYLHSQPPVFNLFLGIILKIFPDNSVAAFQMLYTGCGLILYLSLFRLLRCANVSKVLSFILSTLFAMSPSFVFYEHWLFYTFPLATLLTVAALLCHEMLSKKKTYLFHAFFILLLLLCGIYSLFHLMYYITVAVMLAKLYPALRRKIITSASLPVLLLLALYLKNFILFGVFSASSWMGMSLADVTAYRIQPREAEILVSQGKLSGLSLIKPFSALEKYPDTCLLKSPYPDVLVLNQITRKNGMNNLNHFAYIAISQQYLKDSLATLRFCPEAFFVGVGKALFFYCKASNDYDDFLDKNRARLTYMEELYNYCMYGKWPIPFFYKGKPHYVYVFIVFGIPLLFVFGLRMVFGCQKNFSERSRSRHAMLVFIVFNILYVSLAANLFESSGEGNRIRFMIDPLLVVLLGLFLEKSYAVLSCRAS